MIAAAMVSSASRSRRVESDSSTTAGALAQEAAAVARWLHAIAGNRAHTHYWFFQRHRRPAGFSPSRATDDDTATLVNFVAAGAQSQSSDAATGKFLAMVAGSLEKLDPRYQGIRALRGSRSISYDEIAQALGLNAGTVKIRIARARCNLRAFLAQPGPEVSPAAPLRAGYGADRALAGPPPPVIRRAENASIPCFVPSLQLYPHPSIDPPAVRPR